MPRRKVHSIAQSAATPAQAWSVVRDFCAPWHPAIARMTPEKTVRGGLVRCFTVKGEDTQYRERLTYVSDSEMTMAYTHIAGIAGVQTYDARMTISPASTGAAITMTADLSAPSPRAEEIAAGTQAIFDAGTETVAALAQEAQSAVPQDVAVAPARTETRLLNDLPRLALTTAGDDGETLCLFLHGIGGNRSNWDAQLAAVAPFCKAASMDLRGYGDSTLGPAQSTIDDYCADILHIMTALGADKLVLCGLSYGAWIATSFAMRHPEKLAGLVLSGGCTGMSEAGADERDSFRLSREVPMNAGQTPADFAQAVVDVIAGPSATDQARAALLASMQAIPSATYADALRCFTNPLETFDFSRLDMPVLLMTGAHDRLAPPAEIKNVAERIWDASPEPDVRFEVIADAGHVCNLEQPAAYNTILSQFLARILS